MLRNKLKVIILCIFNFALLVTFANLLYSSVQSVSYPAPVLSVGQFKEFCAWKLHDANVTHVDREKLDCGAIVNGETDQICLAQRMDLMVNFIHPNEASCEYWNRVYSKIPATTPTLPSVAYVILAHSNFEQLEMLIRSLYSTINLFCVHIDSKSEQLYSTFNRYSKCFNNIIEPKVRLPVFWAGMNVLNGTLLCMKELLTKPSWNYVINLSGQDFPNRNNMEIAKFSELLEGKNHLEVKMETKHQKYGFHHQVLYDKNELPYKIERTSIRKKPFRNQLWIFKGNLLAVLNRQFVSWLFKNDTAIAFAEWLGDTDTPDEHYWATLLGNRMLNAPGGTHLIQPYLGRHALWRPNPECRGKFVHDVCIFGVDDLRNFRNVDHLFLNKFHLDFQNAGLWCMLKGRLMANESVDPLWLQTVQGLLHG